MTGWKSVSEPEPSGEAYDAVLVTFGTYQLVSSIAGACGGGSSLPESFDLVGYVAHCIVVGNITGSNIATIIGVCQAVKTIIGITNVSSAALKHPMRRLNVTKHQQGLENRKRGVGVWD
jgi:hypothetical protein